MIVKKLLLVLRALQHKISNQTLKDLKIKTKKEFHQRFVRLSRISYENFTTVFLDTF